LNAGLPEHVAFILQEAGYENVGEVVVKMRQNPDGILALQGIGPKAMQEIEKLVSSVTAVEPQVDAVVEPQAQVAEQLAEAQVATAPVEAATAELAQAAEAQPTSEVSPESEAALAAVEPAEMPVAAVEADVTMAAVDEFMIKPEELITTELIEEEDGDKKSKKKKKKGKQVEIIYDPERDTTLVHKKHKRGDEAFTWEE
jgi:N utilization substance protein A